MTRSILLAAAALLATPASAATLRESIAADMPQLMTLYRDLHANPELSMQEVRTPAKIAGEMRKLGFRVTEKVGKTGMVAVLSNGPGKTLMIRADMDALPVVEQTGLPFASKVRAVSNSGVETGVMHACGHDTHVTAFLATARRLAAAKGSWSGNLVMILQPGEETSQGARAMLEDGLFTRFPKPDVALAFHDSASLAAGTVGVAPGYVMASVDSVDVLVKGVGSHGAAPQNGRDPIVLASRIVSTLQTLVSRERNPLDPSVVTVGSFHGGATHNIIPDEARLQITVRSYTPEVRKALLDGIARVARGEAIAAGMPEDSMPVVTVQDRSTPSTFNTEGITARVQELFAGQFGADRVKAVPPAMVGEDFSRYLLANKGTESLIFWVGGVPKAKWDAAGGDVAKLPSLHSPFWAPDAEAVIGTAAEAMTVAAMDVLKRG